MTHSTTVSVVMAVRNAMPYLREALDSIAAQTAAPLEIIVVDGGSTDDTETVARAFPRVVFMPETGRGFANAWNDGIAAARGEAIAILDSDDLWAPDKLERQEACLAADSAIDGVIGHVEYFLEPGCEPPPGFRMDLLDRSHVAYMPSALLARRRVFDRVGPFRTEWAIASDIDWFARLKDAGVRLHALPEVVLRKRVHDRNLSYNAARTTVINDEMLKVLRASIHRQRAANAADRQSE